VECAVLLQREMAERNNGIADDRRIDVRMGVHVGDVIVEDDDRHGDAVIVAARLQQLADAGGISVSDTVVHHVRRKVALRFEPRGEERLKNIAEPVRIYRIAVSAPTARRSAQHLRRRTGAAAAALVLLLAAAGGAWYFARPTAPQAPAEAARPPPSAAASAAQTPPGQGIPVIVVLPFRDLTGNQIHTDLGAGIAEAFITDLASFPDFEVVSSTSAFAYADRPVPEIVKATGALFVIEGSIRLAGDKVDVTMQLIRGATDRHLKIAQIEETMTDPVTLQKAIASRLRDELGGMTGILREEYNKIALAKPEAERAEYDYYVLGHIHSMCDEGEEAGEIWKQGLARFPDSALLHYKMMIYHLVIHKNGDEATELWNRAEKLERRSALDEWYRHWLTALLKNYRGENEAALAEARATIAMAPYDAVAHNNLSWVPYDAGLYDEAIEWAKFAVTHDPSMRKWYFNALRSSYGAAEKWKDAVAFGEAQVVNDPVHAEWWYQFLGAAYGAAGETDKSTAAWEKAAKLPDPPDGCHTPG
jgi:adenylate cyclase